MIQKSFKKGALIVAMLFVTVVASTTTTLPSYAVSCSGNGCNGKNPSTTGCNQNAYLAARYPFYDNYGIILSPYSSSTPYMNIYYSRSCGTNWVQVTNNPYGGNTYKEIEVIGGYFEPETDWGYGSSYSMMVYAPGSTAIRFWSKVMNTAGVTQARTATTVLR